MSKNVLRFWILKNHQRWLIRFLTSGRNCSKSSRISNGAPKESGASTGPPSCISSLQNHPVCTGIAECHRITLTRPIRRDFDCPPRRQNVHTLEECPPTTWMRAHLTSHILHACGQTDGQWHTFNIRCRSPRRISPFIHSGGTIWRPRPLSRARCTLCARRTDE